MRAHRGKARPQDVDVVRCPKAFLLPKGRADAAVVVDGDDTSGMDGLLVSDPMGDAVVHGGRADEVDVAGDHVRFCQTRPF